jgi:hypothetical protein
MGLFCGFVLVGCLCFCGFVLCVAVTHRAGKSKENGFVEIRLSCLMAWYILLLMWWVRRGRGTYIIRKLPLAGVEFPRVFFGSSLLWGGQVQELVHNKRYFPLLCTARGHHCVVLLGGNERPEVLLLFLVLGGNKSSSVVYVLLGEPSVGKVGADCMSTPFLLVHFTVLGEHTAQKAIYTVI